MTGIATAPEWLAALLRKPGPVERKQVERPSLDNIPEAYIRAAMNAEYETVAGAIPTTRNRALNTAAFNLGQLDHVGMKFSEVSRLLVVASDANGYLADEGIEHVHSVIKSGWEAGLKQPRDVKPSTRPPQGFKPVLVASAGRSVDEGSAAVDLNEATPDITPIRDAKGGYKAGSTRNAIYILVTDTRLIGLFVHNDFTGEIVVTRRPPWALNGHAGGSLTDADITGCVQFMEALGLSVSATIAYAAVQFVASECHVNPVQDALEALVWDGTERLDHWLCDYMGAKETPFTHTVGAKWLIGAVARIKRPGAKVDNMLILEGPQGLKKSTALAAIATLGGEEYFADKLPALGSKDAYMELQGRIIVEIAELDAMRKAEVSQVKAFLSQTIDRFRPPYGRAVVQRPRQCVFAGTVNPSASGYLNDPTGGRRFWPVSVDRVDLDELRAVVPQLWAEAKHRFEAGERWWLEDGDALEEAREQQRERFEVDAWAAKIDPFIETRQKVRISEIMTEALQIETAQQDLAKQRRIGAHLKFHGWERKQWRDPLRDNKPTWYFFAPEAPTEAD